MLKISDNIFQKHSDKNYKRYAIAYLKNLQYLDYELIDNEERIAAKDEYKEEMADAENQANEKQDDKGEQIDPILAETHIAETNKILWKVLEQADEECQKLQFFEKFGDLFNTADGQVEDLTTRYHGDMKTLHKKKKSIIEFCGKKMFDAERDAESNSIVKIEAFKKYEKHCFRQIEN